MPAASTPVPRPSRRNARIALVAALVLLALALALRFVAQPQRATRLLLDRLGNALGLEISATGISEYRLRGTPTLVLRDVVAREPGAATALLRAERIFVSLPWSTIRAGGATLDATRLELDAPVLDLPALQHWLATRPPSEPRLPTLSDGLRVRDGRIINRDAADSGWWIDRIQADLPQLAAAQPLHARLRGRYRAPPLRIVADLAVAVVRPGALVEARATGFAVAGNLLAEGGGDWRLPATITLSGPLVLGGSDLAASTGPALATPGPAGQVLRIAPARLGVAASYDSGDRRVPFAFGAHGPLTFAGSVWTWAPVGVALRGRDDPHSNLVPTLAARGSLAIGSRLLLRLDGALAGWPQAWPSLPAPLGQSQAPLPFALEYAGAAGLSDIATLQLRRDAARFDGRFRPQDISAWLAAVGESAAPLPPLDGVASAEHIEIAGAQLQGVRISLDDPELPDAAP